MNVQTNVIPIATAANSAEQRVARYDWPGLAAELDGYGAAVIEKLLSPEECRQIAALYAHEEHFRAACAPRSTRGSRRSPMNGTSA
jgi:hypothetical protein